MGIPGRSYSRQEVEHEQSHESGCWCARNNKHSSQAIFKMRLEREAENRTQGTLFGILRSMSFVHRKQRVTEEESVMLYEYI